jgi:hypothetical protein
MWEEEALYEEDIQYNDVGFVYYNDVAVGLGQYN